MSRRRLNINCTELILNFVMIILIVAGKMQWIWFILIVHFNCLRGINAVRFDLEITRKF
jgi:hypothetical protein